MTVGVTWLIEGKLVLLKSWGTMSVAEMEMMDSRICEMLDSSKEQLVHAIHDHTLIDHLPSPKNMMKLKVGSHARVGWLFIVGIDNKLMKFFASVTGQAFHIRLRFMDTVEEALKFLQDIDSTLPDLQSLDFAAANARIVEAAVSLSDKPLSIE